MSKEEVVGRMKEIYDEIVEMVKNLDENDPLYGMKLTLVKEYLRGLELFRIFIKQSLEAKSELELQYSIWSFLSSLNSLVGESEGG